MSKKKVCDRVMTVIRGHVFPVYVLLTVGYKWREIRDEIKRQVKEEGVDRHWLLAWDATDENFVDDPKSWKAMHREVRYKGTTLPAAFIHIPRSFDFSDWDMVALAHEVLHICQYVLPEFLDRNQETEAEAYFHSYLMQECLKAMRNENK